MELSITIFRDCFSGLDNMYIVQYDVLQHFSLLSHLLCGINVDACLSLTVLYM